MASYTVFSSSSAVRRGETSCRAITGRRRCRTCLPAGMRRSPVRWLRASGGSVASVFRGTCPTRWSRWFPSMSGCRNVHGTWSLPERCVGLFGVRDFGKAPLHRLCRMHGTGDVLRFGLRVVEGEALLEIGIDRRTSPGGAVCTMWNIL